jgi:hypothetical protein
MAVKVPLNKHCRAERATQIIRNGKAIEGQDLRFIQFAIKMRFHEHHGAREIMG